MYEYVIIRETHLTPLPQTDTNESDWHSVLTDSCLSVMLFLEFQPTAKWYQTE
jgi:hypothetical protein